MAKPRQPVEATRRIPRQQRAAETVAAILEGAAQILEAGGLAAFTTNAVAERAGVALGDVLAEGIAIAEGKIPRGHVTIDAVIDPDVPDLMADGHQLRQMFGNLLANAFEAMEGQGRVRIEIHDDAEARRGEPTPNSLFGNAASVMLGDYMFAHAADFIAQTDSTQVVRTFARTLMMMANGELKQDMTVFEYSEDVQRYLDRITGKTASLFGTAAQGGAMVAGVPAEQVEAMRQFGLALGIAFQIVDDILDFTGDPAVMGKPVGSDLAGGTLTLPAILYMQRRPDDNPVKRAFEGVRRKANIDRAIREILDSDVLDETMRTAVRYGDQARAALHTIPPSEARDTLEGILDYVFARQN